MRGECRRECEKRCVQVRVARACGRQARDEVIRRRHAFATPMSPPRLRHCADYFTITVTTDTDYVTDLRHHAS